MNNGCVVYHFFKDVALLEYRAPRLAAECITSFFTGDKESAVILDVACGTGLVSAHVSANRIYLLLLIYVRKFHNKLKIFFKRSTD